MTPEYAALEQHIKDHPDDCAQRWRLAKHLYAARRYKEALDHLLILRREWEPRLNVARYLAAVYYRLGRHEDAAAELRSASEAWPEDVAVHEQLARVLETSHEQEEALKAWEAVQKLSPRHSAAARAIERLRAGNGILDDDAVAEMESDGLLEPRPGQVCPGCGAQNSIDARTCWQCGSRLVLAGTPRPRRSPTPLPQKKGNSEFWLLLTLLLGLLFVFVAVYFTFREWSLSRLEPEDPHFARTVYAILLRSLLGTRLRLGCILLVAWPLSIWVGLRVTNGRKALDARIWLAGICLTALAYDALWLPLAHWPWIPALLGAASLVLLGGLFRTSLYRLAGAWLIQGTIVAAVACGAFVLLEGTAPVRAFPRIAAYSAECSMRRDPAGHTFPAGETPYAAKFEWLSSGSPWFDAEADEVLFEVTTTRQTEDFAVELRTQEDTLVLNNTCSTPFRFTHEVRTDQPYEILVTGGKGVPVTVKARCVLTLHVGL